MDAMQQTEADQRILVLSTSRLNVREVAVMISDTGPGIPPEVMEKLFDPFFSTKQSGMGMGLAISYRIIEDHNGSIRVTSEKGKGTLFSVQLPSNPDLKLSGVISMSSEPTVFVVDDDQAMRNSLKWLIESVAMKVETFASANAFIESYYPGRSGCLLLDVRMPGMSGLELQEYLQRNSIPDPGNHHHRPWAMYRWQCGR